LKNSKKLKFLLIGGFAPSLINFRGPLLRHLVESFDVYAAAPYIDDLTREKVEQIGAICISTEFERTGINPIKDIKAYFRFKEQVKSIRPDYVLAYTIKPVIFGLRAARMNKNKRFALITGRGSGFEGAGLKGWLVKTIVTALYSNTLKSVDGVIFQNQNDKAFFQSQGILKRHAVSEVIEGTGVDMDHYMAKASKDEPKVIRFLFIARLIKEKGIPELLEAARLLKKKYDNFEVQLLGWVDANPGGISQQEIEEIHKSGLASYLGVTDDIRPAMDAADVFVLPTYYNEGLPRTIQEAMAMKKPIITTDHPGCRETVEEGVNGFLVPVRDSVKLAEAMSYFLDKPEQIIKMGEESFKLASEKFDVHKINKRIVKFMDLGDV